MILWKRHGWRHRLGHKLGAKFLRDWVEYFPTKTLYNVRVELDKANTRNIWAWREIKRLRTVLDEKNRQIKRYS
ncbi:hypothetical protein LCGC14_0542360 [marine sediment metagenome]|uniref:Uncharacterized protein n=1 Tax=marine sediment metagenome TaxID=412755 RepID=A0A0F9UDT2_9ZZZZ